MQITRAIQPSRALQSNKIYEKREVSESKQRLSETEMRLTARSEGSELRGISSETEVRLEFWAFEWFCRVSRGSVEIHLQLVSSALCT